MGEHEGERGAGSVVGGRWRLERLLGRGGFGSVWLAIDGQGGGAVALKLLHRELRGDHTVRERFLREAEILARLDHPGICRLLGFGTESDESFLVMEYVAGKPLRDEIAERAGARRSFTPREIVALLRPLEAALGHAHARGVIHRDLKPVNVMLVEVDGAPSLKVLDFGLAKILGDSSDATTVGRLVGSIFYLAPEQIRARTPTPATDVFAMAAFTFELFTLRRAWARDWDDRPVLVGHMRPDLAQLNGHVPVLQRITSGLRPKVSPLRPDLGPTVGRAVDEVLATAMAIDPEQRFPTAAAFLRALEAALEGRPFERPGAPAAGTVTAARPDVPARPPAIAPADTLIDPSRRALAEPRAPQAETISRAASDEREPGSITPIVGPPTTTAPGSITPILATPASGASTPSLLSPTSGVAMPTPLSPTSGVAMPIPLSPTSGVAMPFPAAPTTTAPGSVTPILATPPSMAEGSQPSIVDPASAPHASGAPSSSSSSASAPHAPARPTRGGWLAPAAIAAVVAIGLGALGLGLRAERKTAGDPEVRARAVPADPEVRAQPLPTARATPSAEPAATRAEPTATRAEPAATRAEPTATRAAEPAATRAEPTATRAAEPAATRAAEPTATRATSAEAGRSERAGDRAPRPTRAEPASARSTLDRASERAASSPQPARAASAPLVAGLRAELAALQASPGDYALAERLSRAITAAADTVGDLDARTAIKRCAASGVLPVDVAVLGACVERLAGALRAGEGGAPTAR